MDTKMIAGRKRNPIPTPFARKRGESVVYYIWVYDDSGKRRAMSTGERTMRDAKVWIKRQLSAGGLVPVKRIKLKDYSADFFGPNCRWVALKRQSGHSIGAEYLSGLYRNLHNHILPILGENYIDTITHRNIEFLQSKLSHLSPASITNVTKGLKIIITEALRDGILQKDPFDTAYLVTNSSVEKQILTYDQGLTLLLEQHWQSPVMWYLNIMAAITGARKGELRGLLSTDIRPDNITINKAMRRISGLTSGTKTGAGRTIPVDPNFIKKMVEFCFWPGFVFSLDGGRTPVSEKQVNNSLNAAIKSAGVPHMVFHGWRHWLNTQALGAGIPRDIVQAVTGHTTDAMTTHYAHLGIDHLAPVVALQKDMLAGII